MASVTPCPIRSVPSQNAAAFDAVRREMILRGGKWDPQVGDTCTLASFPLLISPGTWQVLAGLAECLTVELLAAEREVQHRPALRAWLGLPRQLRRLLGKALSNPTPAGVRSMRFNFHWTDDCLRISEVNSDVSGGYAEASAFPALMADFEAIDVVILIED